MEYELSMIQAGVDLLPTGEDDYLLLKFIV
jgi:hypothetical protein